MTRRSGRILNCWLVALFLLMAACASTPPASLFRFEPNLLESRNGRLRFKIPEGWLNATNDSATAASIIWLVRSDYAATLSVREVGVDTETRREIERSGLVRLADLTLALASSEQGVTVLHQPELASVHGNNICRYAYVAGNSSDRVQVVLLDTGSKVYEIKILETKKMQRDSRENTWDFPKAFVQNLEW